MIDMEIESLDSILNSNELQILDVSEKLTDENSTLVNDGIAKLLRLSLIPNCSKRFVLVDGPKDQRVELRCLPPLNLYLALPTSYPSHSGPLFRLQLPSFYA
jgi:hypothetical protein